MVHIEKLNIHSNLKIQLSSALENFNKAKELSSNSNKTIYEDTSVIREENSIISSSITISENINAEIKDDSAIFSEKMTNKFNKMINNFLFSEYETV